MNEGAKSAACSKAASCTVRVRSCAAFLRLQPDWKRQKTAFDEKARFSDFRLNAAALCYCVRKAGKLGGRIKAAALKGGIFMLALQGRDFISRAGEKLRAAMRMAMGLPQIRLPRNVF